MRSRLSVELGHASMEAVGTALAQQSSTPRRHSLWLCSRCLCTWMAPSFFIATFSSGFRLTNLSFAKSRHPTCREIGEWTPLPWRQDKSVIDGLKPQAQRYFESPVLWFPPKVI